MTTQTIHWTRRYTDPGKLLPVNRVRMFGVNGCGENVEADCTETTHGWLVGLVVGGRKGVHMNTGTRDITDAVNLAVSVLSGDDTGTNAA